MKDFSYITNSHPSFIEGLYRDFTENPEGVDPELRKFFEGFDFAMSFGKDGAGGGNDMQRQQLPRLRPMLRRKG